jgi:hypothetical protein
MRMWILAAMRGLASGGGQAQDVPSAPHCAANEVAFFTSRMGTSVWNDARTKKRLKGDKILSICVDKFPQSRQLVVGFGKPGALDLDTSLAPVRFQLSSQQISADLSWTALTFDAQGLRWLIVQPEGGNARDVFLAVGRNGSILSRTEAIDEAEHWLRYKKKFGKKKVRDVPVGLADLPAMLAPRSKDGIDAAKVEEARYAPNLSLPK